MLITILADASHCPQSKVGGYGYWIASDRGKKNGGGILKGLIDTSSLAEMMAIANAFHIAAKSNIVQQGDRVLIQTDCEAAIQSFRYGRKLTLPELKTVEYVLNLVASLSVVLEFRHVKAHTSRKDNRSLVNKVCDKAARKAMRHARRQFQIDTLKQMIQGETNEELYQSSGSGS